MNTQKNEPRYKAEDLTTFAISALTGAGLGRERARVVAEALVAGDLMGHATHGIKLLVPYLGQLKEGKMEAGGEPEVIRDTGSTLTWDGRYLPGPWLVQKGIDTALERVSEYPVMTVVIGRSHHIGCLAVYPERATEKGLMMILSCSDPKNRTIAPFGGTTGVYSPNPVAGGIPTSGAPIIFDISTSSTAVGTVMGAQARGEQLPHPWLLDRNGNVTRDPATFFEEPPSTILPLGGMDLGYKGFALGLLTEALTNGLSGTGRREQPERWGASVFLQLLDPAAFGGAGPFEKESSWLVEACRKAETGGEGSVRMPGSRALRLRNEQLEKGVRIAEETVLELRSATDLPFPQPL